MTVVPGGRIGPYEIVALLGRGGMGSVFLAYDTNLHRRVARARISFARRETPPR